MVVKKIICSDNSTEYYFYLLIGIIVIIVSLLFFILKVFWLIGIIAFLIGFILLILSLRLIYCLKKQLELKDDKLFIREEVKTYKYFLNEIENIRVKRNIKLQHKLYIKIKNEEKEKEFCMSKWAKEFENINDIIKKNKKCV